MLNFNYSIPTKIFFGKNQNKCFRRANKKNMDQGYCLLMVEEV